MKTKYVYLIHAEQEIGGPKHKARHYLGSAQDVQARLLEHQRGSTDSKFMQALHFMGIGFYLARVWEGGRQLERSLKNRKNSKVFCPICRGTVQVPLPAGFQYFAPHPYDEARHEAWVMGREALQAERMQSQAGEYQAIPF